MTGLNRLAGQRLRLEYSYLRDDLVDMSFRFSAYIRKTNSRLNQLLLGLMFSVAVLAICVISDGLELRILNTMMFFVFGVVLANVFLAMNLQHFKRNYRIRQPDHLSVVFECDDQSILYLTDDGLKLNIAWRDVAGVFPVKEGLDIDVGTRLVFIPDRAFPGEGKRREFHKEVNRFWSAASGVDHVFA